MFNILVPVLNVIIFMLRYMFLIMMASRIFKRILFLFSFKILLLLVRIFRISADGNLSVLFLL